MGMTQQEIVRIPKEELQRELEKAVEQSKSSGEIALVLLIPIIVYLGQISGLYDLNIVKEYWYGPVMLASTILAAGFGIRCWEKQFQAELYDDWLKGRWTTQKG